MSREKVPRSQHDCGIGVGAAIVFKYAEGSESTLMKLVQKEGPQSPRGWSSRRNPGRRITNRVWENGGHGTDDKMQLKENILWLEMKELQGESMKP